MTDGMESEDEKVHSIWVDWENRVISFRKADGFEERQYPTHEEMFQFAIQKGNEGFGIQ